MNTVTEKSKIRSQGTYESGLSEIQLIDSIRFDEKGLVPAIAQDYNNGEVLMLAYMNRDALEKTLTTGNAHYYSRSRKALWLKGETSGNIQRVREVYYDCDADTILLKVEQVGVACHAGERSCFFNPIMAGKPRTLAKVRDKGENKKPPDGASLILNEVYRVILSRKESLPQDSYVASLLKGGLDKILQKVREESEELIESATEKGRDEIIHEMADLWFHTLCLLGYKDIALREVYEELRKRFGISGIEEKRRRTQKAD